jgi:hypothetical protein
MNRPQFASITADLLARKGEARPWDAANSSSAFMPVSPPAPAAPPPVIAAPPTIARAPEPRLASPAPMVAPAAAPAAPRETMKKCAIRISDRDYERLGLLAVKRNTTRQKLLQDAVEQLLAGLPAKAAGCPCIGGK